MVLAVCLQIVANLLLMVRCAVCVQIVADWCTRCLLQSVADACLRTERLQTCVCVMRVWLFVANCLRDACLPTVCLQTCVLHTC